MLVASAGPALAQSATEAWEPPTQTITRYDENWNTLADPAAPRTGRWTERLKYIPIDDDSYLTTGLELRLRNEDYAGNQWGDAPDQGYVWVRAMPYADLHVGRVRTFVQPLIAYAAGVKPAAGPIDQTRVDLLQAFADVRLGSAQTGDLEGTGVTLRFGRQMLSLGTERLIGTRYGPNVPLAFDGYRALASLGGARLSLIAVRPVAPGLASFDDRRSRAKSLWGAYATVPGLDVYYLGYRNTKARFGGETRRELRHSLGLRWFGSVDAGWHWNVEGVAQFGRFGDQRIGAWTLGTEVGHRFAHVALKPDAVLRLNVVSGDKKAGDGRLGTFNALFPKGKYFGELSPVGPTNIVSLNPSVALSLSDTVSASVAGMAYWRYSRGDGVYDIPGNLIRAPGTARSRFIGKEAEATLAWQATPELELSTSLSAFQAGDFLRETGRAKTIVMLGLESNFRF